MLVNEHYKKALIPTYSSLFFLKKLYRAKQFICQACPSQQNTTTEGNLKEDAPCFTFKNMAGSHE